MGPIADLASCRGPAVEIVRFVQWPDGYATSGKSAALSPEILCRRLEEIGKVPRADKRDTPMLSFSDNDENVRHGDSMRAFLGLPTDYDGVPCRQHVAAFRASGFGQLLWQTWSHGWTDPKDPQHNPTAGPCFRNVLLFAEPLVCTWERFKVLHAGFRRLLATCGIEISDECKIAWFATGRPEGQPERRAWWLPGASIDALRLQGMLSLRGLLEPPRRPTTAAPTAAAEPQQLVVSPPVVDENAPQEETRRRAQSIITAACARLATVQAGSRKRNKALNKVAYLIGGMLAGGLLLAADESWAVVQMLEACEVNGYAGDRRQYPRLVVASAIAAGRRHPMRSLPRAERLAGSKQWQERSARLVAWANTVELLHGNAPQRAVDRLVLVALARMMNVSSPMCGCWSAWPNRDTLARAAGLTGRAARQNVSRSTRCLEEAGILEVTRPAWPNPENHANRYRFAWLRTERERSADTNKVQGEKDARS
ncbi:MAG: hypothetical protein WDA71_12050 [Actinomycetota bacterium]